MELVPDPSRGSFRLSEVLSALSHALDLTDGQPVGHAARSCVLGLRIADESGLEEDDRNALFYALLLKDAGCSSSAARLSTLFGVDDLVLKADGKRVDWSRPGEVLRFVSRHAGGGSPLRKLARVGSLASRLKREGHGIVETRCERGADVVRQLDLPEAAAVAVRELDEHWDGSGQPYGMRGDEISIVGRIGCVAQNAELFLAAGGQTTMRKMLADRRGRWFEPELADALLAIDASDPVWRSLGNGSAERGLALLAPEDLELDADDARLDRIAETFATIVDAKSPYTARHSAGVALHAATIGAQLGFSGVVLRDLRRGALLHDLGKLGISNTILDKPGKLDQAEFTLIRCHPVFTEQILARVPAFAPLAAAAAAHHERIDGGGYPHGLQGRELTPYSRVLAVSDVFEALTADRPYRAGMPVDQALAIMRSDAGTHLCVETLAALERGVDRALPLAA